MKRMLCWSAIAAGLWAMMPFQSFAAEVSGWERPVYQAQMSVVSGDSASNPVRDVELIMTQVDGQRSPSGFVLLIDGQSIAYEVQHISEDRCGGSRIIATQTREGTDSECDSSGGPARCHGPVMPGDDGSLSLQIRQEGSCLSAESGQETWQASVSGSGRGDLQLTGTPERVFSIDN